MGYCSHEVCIFKQVSVYKSSICYLWLGFSKFKQSFSFVTRIFHFISGMFFVSLPSEAPTWRFTSIVILIIVLLNMFPVSSSSTSDFNIIQDFFCWHSNHLIALVKLTHPTRFYNFSLSQRLQHHQPKKPVLYRGIWFSIIVSNGVIPTA